MSGDLAQYPEYQESGSPWLGLVPKHWNIQSFRSLTQARSERNHPNLTLLSVERERGVIVRDRESLCNHNFIPDDLSNYKFAKQGDLVINKMKAWQGSMGIAPCDGIVSPAYYVFRFAFANRQFAQRMLRSKPYIAHFCRSSDGVRIGQWDLSIPGMRNIPVLVPPTDEQALIVRFLDWASVRLGKAIAAKRKVIGLLEEQRKAVIQTAVDEVSGADCKTIPIRALLRPVKRLGFPKQELLSLFRDYGVIPKDSRENKNADVRDLALCQLVNSGDVVMNKMKAWQGSIAVSNLEGIVSPDYMVLKFLIQPIVPLFYHYALRSPAMIANYRRVAYGVRPGQWRLMYPDFARLRLPLPSVEQQQATVDRINSNTEAIESAVSRIRREISLLREYQTRLISDVVTGKLDVREFARSLPDDISGEAAELAANETFDEDFATDDELIEEAV